MNIAVAVKIVPDDQDIAVTPERALDYSKAHQVVSEYDLNAIEAAAQLASEAGARLIAIAASTSKADDLKVKKAILSRGPEELRLIADDRFEYADSRTTALALAKIIAAIEGGVDLVVCGDGSADLYAGQVDVQLACELDVPVVNSVCAMRLENGALVVERTLDDKVEELEVPLPAVVAVAPEIALPRIVGMREILAAGKKPAIVENAASAGTEYQSTIKVAGITAPELADRKRIVFDMKADGEFTEFAKAVASSIR